MITEKLYTKGLIAKRYHVPLKKVAEWYGGLYRKGYIRGGRGGGTRPVPNDQWARWGVPESLVSKFPDIPADWQEYNNKFFRKKWFLGDIRSEHKSIRLDDARCWLISKDGSVALILSKDKIKSSSKTIFSEHWFPPQIRINELKPPKITVKEILSEFLKKDLYTKYLDLVQLLGYYLTQELKGGEIIDQEISLRYVLPLPFSSNLEFQPFKKAGITSISWFAQSQLPGVFHDFDDTEELSDLKIYMNPNSGKQKA